jgi:hypothetical protein
MTEVSFESPFVCSYPATKSMTYCEDSPLPWGSCQMLNGAGYRVYGLRHRQDQSMTEALHLSHHLCAHLLLILKV